MTTNHQFTSQAEYEAVVAALRWLRRIATVGIVVLFAALGVGLGFNVNALGNQASTSNHIEATVTKHNAGIEGALDLECYSLKLAKQKQPQLVIPSTIISACQSTPDGIR